MNPRFIPRGALPDSLREDDVQPAIDGLWLIGDELARLEPRVAIVGARKPTPYGTDVARALAGGLAEAGVVVVSGLAIGIDGAAHRGALSVPHGRSIAVLAGGVDRPYPACNADLYETMCARGAVVSENPLGTAHRRELFLLRNRIIAALSLGVVLVQADPKKSGTLSTIRAARQLHREIFAVPGDIRAAISMGPHDQLRAGAHLCTSADDVLEVLATEIGRARERVSPIPSGLSEDELAVLAALADGPSHAEAIARRADRDPIVAVRTLTRLELSGLVRREHDATYRRTR